MAKVPEKGNLLPVEADKRKKKKGQKKKTPQGKGGRQSASKDLTEMSWRGGVHSDRPKAKKIERGKIKNFKWPKEIF